MENKPTEADSQEMDMAQLLAEHEAAQTKAADTHAIQLAKVVSIQDDGVLVDVGEKKEAFIPRKEFRETLDFTVGESIPVLIFGNRAGGNMRVSWRAANERMAWEHIEQSKARNLPVQAKIKSETKGGMILECEGILSAFMPASHVDIRPVKNHKTLIGQSVQTYIVESDPSKGKLILSRKLWLSEENQKKKAETLANLKTGETRKGVVTGITSFGAFIDLGGIEGLLHIGELDWAHTKKVSDLLKTGQEIEVKIIKFDTETGKISLSRKELLPHPWEGVESRFPVGTVVQGKVVSLTDFGCFVEIGQNVEGLLHSTEISWKELNPKPKTYLKKGQVVDVKIISVNREKEKISLSMKRTQENPWNQISKEFPVGSKTRVVITNLVPFGAFARLSNGIEGLIHISDFSWVKRIAAPQDILKVGDEIEVKILEISADKEKISFGIKQLKTNPYDTYRKGTHVSGPVTKVSDAGVVVQIEADVEGFVPAFEVSNDKTDTPGKLFKVGDAVEAKVILVDAKERKIQLSVRQLEQELQRQAVKKYSVRAPRPNLGELLDS